MGTGGKTHANTEPNILEYKGYHGVVEFDDEAGIFHGDVADLQDVITFQGESVGELRQAFRDSVDDYLDFCAELGRDPEKPFSGSILVRMDPELHRKITVWAKRSKKSVNRFVVETLKKAVT